MTPWKTTLESWGLTEAQILAFELTLRREDERLVYINGANAMAQVVIGCLGAVIGPEPKPRWWEVWKR